MVKLVLNGVQHIRFEECALFMINNCYFFFTLDENSTEMYGKPISWKKNKHISSSPILNVL